MCCVMVRGVRIYSMVLNVIFIGYLFDLIIDIFCINFDRFSNSSCSRMDQVL